MFKEINFSGVKRFSQLRHYRNG